MTLAAMLLRTFWRKADAARDKGRAVPNGVEWETDIPYGSLPAQQCLDVYRPRAAAGCILPVIVNVHGGGWVYGNKELYRFYAMSLAEQGFAVVNFTYRLAPRYRHPAQLEDLNAVIRWTLENAEAKGFDRSRIFLVGDSAGAQLAALYTGLCTVPVRPDAFSALPIPEHFVPRALALNCGSYQLTGNRPFLDLNWWLLYDLLGPRARKQAKTISPLEYVTAAYPSVFLMTANRDFLRRQAPLMRQRLTECGVRCEYRMYGTEERPLGHVFHCNLNLPEAVLCNWEECAFFGSL